MEGSKQQKGRGGIEISGERKRGRDKIKIGIGGNFFLNWERSIVGPECLDSKIRTLQLSLSDSALGYLI